MLLPDLWTWVQGVNASDLPPATFALHPGQTVIDAERWLRATQRDALSGPAGTRAKLGVIQRDLRWIYDHISSKP